ncbi:MAG: hypothetical protein HY343_08435 [Lentisphaerae bacterium]|nr:hypothetical protein [Lentisphaerota bacterium]
MNFAKRLTSYSRQATRFHAVFVGACVLGCASAAHAQVAAQPAKTGAPAAKAPAAVSAPAATYNNELTLSAGYVAVDGDGAAFSQRQQIPSDEIFGGVESLHYEDAVGKDTTLTLDGRAIADNHDYKLGLNLVAPDVGYLKADYTEFRTWSDGSGGYIPVSGAWREAGDQELALDRGTFSVEAGLTQPDLPQLTLKYEHQFRDGRKSSTIWGDSTDGGLLRTIVPTFLDIDETRDIVSADGTHTFGNTELGLGVRYETDDLENSRNITRGTGTSALRYVTIDDAVDTDIFDAHAFTDTAFNKKVRLTTGYMVSRLDSDIGGSRIFGSSYDATFDANFARRQYHDEGYTDLDGSADVRQYVANANLMLVPADNLTVTPAIRIEKLDAEGDTMFAESNVGAAPTFTTAVEELEAFNERGLVDATEELEVRYTGIRDWVLYAAAELTEGEGDYSEMEVEAETQEIDMNRETDDTRLVQKYTGGATWYPLKALSLASQYYHKISDNEYDHVTDPTTSASDQYPGYITELDVVTDDINVRATWRPFNVLTTVTRYDLQLATVDQDGTTVDASETADTTAHIVSESITWTPMASVYLQANLNYARNRTTTPADEATGAAANRVVESRNDYWNFNQVVGLAVAEKTDLQLQYSHFRASDYLDNSSYGVPYGADLEENSVTATLKQEIGSGMQVALKYGFYMSRDDASGGNNDYDAHLVSTSMQYLF